MGSSPFQEKVWMPRWYSFRLYEVAGGIGPRLAEPARSGGGPASRPRISVSPEIDSGFWKTSPGGWTVMDAICGRRLRWRYADAIESRMGEAPSLPMSVAFTCRNRARSLTIGSPPPRT